MDRHRENVGPFVEDALRAVAVVHIDIENRDALVLQLKLSRRHCAVVEKAGSAREIAVGMMTGRPAKGIGCVLTVHDKLGSRGSDIGRGTGGSPGAGTDRARGVDRVPAEATDDVVG